MKYLAPRLASALACAFALAFALSLAACSGDVAVAGVTLDQAAMALAPGGAGALAATVAPGDATNKGVAWNSSNEAVATVAGSGPTVSVNALEEGESVITVTTADGGKTATCTVTVAVAVTGVTLDPAAMSLIEGGPPVTLTAAVEPADATNKAVTWWSSNEAVATVAGSGLAAMVSPLAPGAAIITATSEADATRAATCVVDVGAYVPVAGVTLGTRNTSMALGANEALVATVLPPNATYKSVAWESSNTAAATVTPEGVVTAVGYGPATITVKTVDGGHTASCGVTLVNVFVGGQMNMRPMLWKNGYIWIQERTGPLSSWDNGRAYSIVVTDAGDVYVGGRENHVYSGPDSHEEIVPRVWKNGSALYRLENAGYAEEAVLSIAVQGGTVYSAGYSAEESGYVYPRLWTNDAMQTLTSNGSAMAFGVAAAAGHVYVAGADSGNVRLGVLWEDGARYVLNATSGLDTYVNTVAASGNDVYVGGQDNYHATVWRNRVPYTLDVPDCFVPGDASWGETVSGLCVVGDDVYAAGAYYDPFYDSYYNSSGWIAAMWKNGSPTVLQIPDHAYAEGTFLGSEGLSVSVFGDDVYVSGYYTTNRGGWGIVAPVLWKNGRVAMDCGGEGWWYWGDGWSLDGYTRGETVCVAPVAPGVESVSITQLPKEWYDPAGDHACMAGFNKRLSAIVQPAGAPNGVAWVSSNGAVATVSRDGVVTGVAQGDATITATTLDGGKAAGWDMHVYPSTRATGVTLDKTEVSLGLGEDIQINAQVQPSDATNKGVVWRMSDSSLFFWNHGQGNPYVSVQARAAGQSTLTATTSDGHFVASCVINVGNEGVAPAAGVVLDHTRAALAPGEAPGLEAGLLPANVSGDSGAVRADGSAGAVRTATPATR